MHKFQRRSSLTLPDSNAEDMRDSRTHRCKCQYNILRVRSINEKVNDIRQIVKWLARLAMCIARFAYPIPAPPG